MCKLRSQFFDVIFYHLLFQRAVAERDQIQQQNHQLQHKLAEYFRKKKPDDRSEVDKNVADQEQRYLKYMGMQ